MTTIARGFVFSLDALGAFLILLAMVFLMLGALDNAVAAKAEENRNFSLKKNALFLADSLVKNRDENNPLLGAAVFDAGKKRVLSNELDFGLLKEIGGIDANGFFVKTVSLEWKDANRETIFSSGKPGANCVSAERFVLANNRKAKLTVRVCDEPGLLP